MKDARISDYPDSVIAETDKMIAKGNLVRAIGGAAYLEAAKDERIADKQGTFPGSEDDEQAIAPEEYPPYVFEGTDEDEAFGLRTSSAPTRFLISAQTRELGLRNSREIKARIQKSLDDK
jgi:hypothetical protein